MRPEMVPEWKMTGLLLKLAIFIPLEAWIRCSLESENIRFSVDFLSEFQYDTEYLHAGIIYEGVTYSLVDNKMEELAIPSMFLAMEKSQRRN